MMDVNQVLKLVTGMGGDHGVQVPDNFLQMNDKVLGRSGCYFGFMWPDASQ